MLVSTTNELPQLLEIDTDNSVDAVTFTANDKLLVSGNNKCVQVWRVADGKEVATMPTEYSISGVAASNDGRWIAAGTDDGQVFVWNATTYERVLAGRTESDGDTVRVDFSPESARLVSTGTTAIIWDVTASQKVQTLTENSVFAAKYSPQGDRIATASDKSVRVWDSNDGRLLVDVRLQPWVSTLRWCNDHLFVLTHDYTAHNTIKKINAATGSSVWEWRFPDAFGACLALSPNGQFIACSTDEIITFWDTATHSQLGRVQHSDFIRSIACSSDGRHLTIVSGGEITIKTLFQFISVPELDIDDAALDAWKRGQIADAEALLSAAIPAPESRHHALASRSLIRARLGQWVAALVDAKESIKTQRSLVGYAAMCVALIGIGKKDEGFRVYDIAFLCFPSDQVSLLLLIKAVILFMSGKHVDAISRMDDLITHSTALWADPALYVVQAYMYLLVGNMHMESSNYERAIQSFEAAQVKLGDRTCQPPLIVSLISGWEFDDLVITIQQRLCEALFSADRIKESAESLLRIVNQGTNMTDSIKTWVSDFTYRCRQKLEALGDTALNAKQYGEAVSQYTVALSLGPVNPLDLLVKRSKAYARSGKWDDALNDANKVIELDSSSLSGYERKYTVLLSMGHNDDAIAAFEMMLLKMSQSSDPNIRERSCHYVRPEHTKEVIRTSIKNATCDSPLVLINALSGRLCNKSQQAAAFESTPAFARLITSMTTRIDHKLIGQVVGEFYRYITFSHTWEGNEPLYEEVTKIMVYDLRASPTHEKLKMFCKIVRAEGFNWAWSDTCCIDQRNPMVLQEALVSMFKWYEGSAMTMIFLCDVDRLAEVGALMRSLWNSRGWTLQEYHASKVVRIYTKDWTPYLGLTNYNHKDAPEIVSEMEQATGISARGLMALRPGLNDTREKLRLASTRQTTRVEDAAYSLLGIFSMTLPVTYGEGDKALGRLLSQLLTSSGDTNILAWTGTSNSFNSCLPSHINVFSKPLSDHIPPAIADAEMETITAMFHASELNLVTRLYTQVVELPTPTFAAQRMRLPCLAFKIRSISTFQNGSEGVFHAQAGALGVVEIRSSHNLTALDSLCLVHPWIDFLLDRHAVGNIAEITPREDESPSGPSDASVAVSDAELLLSPPMPSMDTQMKFLARLRQPFGALLLAPTRRNMAEYKRIATESLIRVQVQEITPATLNRLTQGVRVLDVL